MDELDSLSHSKETPGEENVYLVGMLEDGVEKLYLSILHPGDIDQNSIPPEAIVGRLKEQNPPGQSPFTPGNIIVNSVFVAFLQDVVRRRGAEDPELIISARMRKEGMGLMLDRRCVEKGNIEFEDLIGAFEIKDGKIVPESYQENEHYEVVSKDGFMTLGHWLEGILLEEFHLRFGGSPE